MNTPGTMLAAGLVKPGGRAETLLRAIEEAFIAGKPQNLGEADEVLNQALEKAGLGRPAGRDDPV